MDNVHPFTIIAPIAIILFFWWMRTTVRQTEEKANQGDVESQYWLAKYYGNGHKDIHNGHSKRASPPDYVTAYAWAHIAELNTLKRGQKVTEYKPSFAQDLTPEQISEAEELATEMIEENPKLIGG